MKEPRHIATNEITEFAILFPKLVVLVLKKPVPGCYLVEVHGGDPPDIIVDLVETEATEVDTTVFVDVPSHVHEHTAVIAHRLADHTVPGKHRGGTLVDRNPATHYQIPPNVSSI
jgi:hypothetical protein